MKGFDILIYACIAIMYNLLIHNLASVAYEDLQYDDKDTNTIIMLIIFGFGAIIVSKIINNKKKYNNKYVRNGLYYGGILLLVTSLFTNWTDVGNEMKLAVMSLCFGGLIWYGYKIEDKTN